MKSVLGAMAHLNVRSEYSSTDKMKVSIAKLFVLLGLIAAGSAASAHNLTLEECLEGASHVRNTALGRNNISREVFMETMIGDIARIQQYPPELRWFVQDDQDAELLLRHDELAFTNPRDPEIHHDEFLAECQTRMNTVPALESTNN